MHLRTGVHVFITLLVLLQVTAPANGGLLREIYRKFLTVLHGEFTWPCMKWFPKSPTGLVYHGCQLCAWGNCRPVIQSVLAPRFIAEADAISLYNFFNQGSNDGDLLTKTLINRSELERNAIADAYQTDYSEQLRERVRYSAPGKSVLYKILMTVLATPLPIFFAEQFATAMMAQADPYQSEMGRTFIIELLTTLPRCMIVKVMAAYNEVVKKDSDFIVDLNKSLESQPSEYRNVIEKLANDKRDQNMHTSWINAMVDAFKLKRAIESNHVIKIYKRFSEVFTKRSFPQVVETMKVYENLRHDNQEFKSLFDDISQYLGKCKEVYALMVRILTNKPLYFATVLEKILKKKSQLSVEDGIHFIAIIRGRLDIDLQDIIDVYNAQSKRGIKHNFDSVVTSPDDQIFRDAMDRILQ